jgi:hypothetical protein
VAAKVIVYPAAVTPNASRPENVDCQVVEFFLAAVRAICTRVLLVFLIFITVHGPDPGKKQVRRAFTTFLLLCVGKKKNICILCRSVALLNISICIYKFYAINKFTFKKLILFFFGEGGGGNNFNENE